MTLLVVDVVVLQIVNKLQEREEAAFEGPIVAEEVVMAVAAVFATKVTKCYSAEIASEDA
jgi:hypothetical protein